MYKVKLVFFSQKYKAFTNIPLNLQTINEFENFSLKTFVTRIFRRSNKKVFQQICLLSFACNYYQNYSKAFSYINQNSFHGNQLYPSIYYRVGEKKEKEMRKLSLWTSFFFLPKNFNEFSPLLRNSKDSVDFCNCCLLLQCN